MAADTSMKRVYFGESWEDLVHEWAGVFVVAEKVAGNWFRGVSHGKALVMFSREIHLKKYMHSASVNRPIVKGAVDVQLIHEDNTERVWRVKEVSTEADYRGEEVCGTLGQVAEGGCWYATREEAEAAAKRWKVINGKGRAIKQEKLLAA